MTTEFPIAYTPSEHETQFVDHFGESGIFPVHCDDAADRKTYVICFTNRCGSNLLAELISTHPAFGKAGEYLNAVAVLKNSRQRGQRTLAEYLEWLRRTRSSKQGVLGIKLSYRQLFFLVRTGFVESMFGEVRFIHITRRDVLMQAVSHGIASQTKAWTSKQVGGENRPVVAFKPSHIVRLMDHIHESNAKLRTFFDVYGIEPIEVNYEDLVLNPQGVGDNVLRQLGYAGPDATVQPQRLTLRKQSSAMNEEFAQRIRDMYRLRSHLVDGCTV